MVLRFRAACCVLAVVSVVVTASESSLEMAIFERLGDKYNCSTTDFNGMMNGMLEQVNDNGKDVGMPKSRVTIEFDLKMDPEDQAAAGGGMPEAGMLDSHVQKALETLTATWGIPPGLAAVAAIQPALDNLERRDDGPGAAAEEAAPPRFQSLRFKAVVSHAATPGSPPMKTIKYKVEWVVSTVLTDVFVGDLSKNIMCGPLAAELLKSANLKASSNCPTADPHASQQMCAKENSDIGEAISFGKSSGCSTSRVDEVVPTNGTSTFACELNVTNTVRVANSKAKLIRDQYRMLAIAAANARAVHSDHKATTVRSAARSESAAGLKLATMSPRRAVDVIARSATVLA